MEKDAEITKVVFRKWADGGIIALFPEETWVGCCMSYEHVGQHGGADYVGIVQQTKLATATEYADLKEELESLGYNLQVYKRCRVNFG